MSRNPNPVENPVEQGRPKTLAAARAERLLVDAARLATRRERARARRLGALVEDPVARELLFALTDTVLRTPASARSMAQLRALVRNGLPSSLPVLDRLALQLAAVGSSVAPQVVAAAVRRRIRAETQPVIVAATDPEFARHVEARRRQGFDLNVNLLGEAILGDDEAEQRLQALCARVRRPDVDYVSAKVSALCANLDVLAFGHEVDRIAGRLRILFGVAAEQRPAAFVNLDMEEYRDLHLTVEAFCRVLDEPRFHGFRAGIVLQAYLPDAHDVFDRLAEWAARRHLAGGAEIKVRLVKGANLAMEHVEAELAGWEPAPYASKLDVDASFKALLARGMDAAAGGGLTIGVASHNLFDVAWALVERDRRNLAGRVDIEMLEGMAPPQSRAVLGDAGAVRLYTPVVEAEEFTAGIAYLARRLDENSGRENFLRSLFSIEPGSPTWRAERARFDAALDGAATVGRTPRRTQDRSTETIRFHADAPFANVSDSDFTHPGNRAWIARHMADDRPLPLPPLVRSTAGIDELVARAREAATRWARTSSDERRQALARVAEALAAGRGRMIAVMAHETGKVAREGDAEVSEAIDFATWALASTTTLDELEADGVHCRPLGVVLVAGPWNFPLAIPANGTFSAVAAGNAVLLKPAPEAVATATELVHLLHEAGLPDGLVQLVHCPDDDTGRHLVTHEGVDAVVLTGAYETARMFLDWRPGLRLMAETSGKNTLVVSQTADVDGALKDLVRSAFGHAGQKCSAASLAILEAPLYDDPRVLHRLADAVRSLRVGPADDLASTVGPLIKPPTGALWRALHDLDEGESWLVEPRPLDDEGRLWTPGVRLGVRPGSWFHRTECFGPVLGVMRADDLDQAIEWQNAVDFGLTGGLHSLDDLEIERWLEQVAVGNAYVNRHITGAIVRRQPFGGWKRSSVGRSAKTGGPEDILRFVGHDPAAATATLSGARASYRSWWQRQYGIERDDAALRAEANIHRYRPVSKVVVRVAAGTSPLAVASLRAAARVAKVPVEVSAPVDGIEGTDIVESDAALAARLPDAGAERLRLLGPRDDGVLAAAHAAAVVVDGTPVTHHGRVELPCWLREQAISRTLHRHGRLAES